MMLESRTIYSVVRGSTGQRGILLCRAGEASPWRIASSGAVLLRPDVTLSAHRNSVCSAFVSYELHLMVWRVVRAGTGGDLLALATRAPLTSKQATASPACRRA